MLGMDSSGFQEIPKFGISSAGHGFETSLVFSDNYNILVDIGVF